MPMKRISFPILFLCLLGFIPAHSQSPPTYPVIDPPFLSHQDRWVDSVFRTLSVNEKIGQLMMPRGNYNANYDTARLNQIVRKYHVGGFVLFAGSPVRQATLVNKLQSLSKVPLLIGMDLEWGLAMRLDSTVRFPYQMTLGAMQGHDDLIEQMGLEIARQCKRMGVHINYAPVADVNNNPNNPVINFRSFGENPRKVAEKALAYMRGLQQGGILTSIKHFPGHGDTGTDSHSDLPLIQHNRQRLDSVELYPFRELIRQGASGVMVAHLSIPTLDATKNLASTMSKPIVTDLLRKQLGFKGLIFTDAMDMQGATKFFPEGKANVKAILAGNDVLETFVDVPAAFNAVKKALLKGEITQAEIDARVKRILAAKAWVGLNHYQPVEIRNLIADLNPKSSEALNRKLSAATITLLHNQQNVLPLRTLDTLRIASLVIGNPVLGKEAAPAGQPTDFQKMLSNYTTVAHFNLDENSADSVVRRVRESLKRYNLVLIAVNGLSVRPGNNYGIKPKIQSLVKSFVQTPHAIVTLFSNAYTLGKFENLDKAQALITTYQESTYAQEAAAQLIFGAIDANGKLPVMVNSQFKYNEGMNITNLSRLAYGVPEEVGLDSDWLTTSIDSIAQQAIMAKATPGCQVVVAKDGKVIFQKSYGYHTYENKIPVTNQDMYDLASITKVSASVPALMRLEDEGKFNLSMTMGEFVPEWKKSNKADLVYKDILTHQARLRAWIPFWMDCIDSLQMVTNSPVYQEKYAKKYKLSFFQRLFARKKGVARIRAAIQTDKKLWTDCVNPAKDPIIWKPNTFSYAASADYPTQVAEHLWIHKDYDQTIVKAIEDSPLRDKKEYVYSDLSYYLYPQIIQRLTGKDWDTYLKETFYKPLGANSLTYNPLRFFPLNQIVPTEYDSLFRKNLIQGHVHDEGAAMLNGISGHAGLFGTANDLAKLMQLYLQKGYYGGKHYINEATVQEWISYPFSEDINSRRGVGFDKPDRKKPGISTALDASPRSFGHSGFTGTYTWVDPEYNLVYVFLSNRVYPTRNNSKLSELNTRTNILQTVYESIKKGDGTRVEGGIK